MLGLATALALSVAQPPAAMNAERYWSLKTTSPTSCRAVARSDNGEVVLLGLDGRISFGISGGNLARDAKTIELRLGDRRQTFPAKATQTTVWENGEGLSGASIVALRSAKTLVAVLDGRVAMSLDLAGSGTAKLVDDLIDCSQGKPGWWDGASAPAAPVDPSARRTAAGQDDSLLPPAPPGAKPGSIRMGPAGSK